MRRRSRPAILGATAILALVGAVLSLSIAGAVALAGAALAGNGQVPPDPAMGKRFAMVWCAQCHLVGPEQTKPAVADVPSFEALANDPKMTPERLNGFLHKSHPPMPDFKLDRDEVRDITAYIESLKR